VEEKDKIREEEEKDVEAHGSKKKPRFGEDEPKAEGEKENEDDVELHGKKRR